MREREREGERERNVKREILRRLINFALALRQARCF